MFNFFYYLSDIFWSNWFTMSKIKKIVKKKKSQNSKKMFYANSILRKTATKQMNIFDDSWTDWGFIQITLAALVCI